MKTWRKRDACSTLEEVIERNTGMPVQQFLSPARTPIANLDDAANRILNAVRRKKRITIYGDYDADGITASAILTLLLRALNCEPQVIIPRRFTDGYGFNVNRVADIDGDLLITIDNGITAIDAIDAAKNAGKEVVVIDHHLPAEAGLPKADVIVDPHVFKAEGDFDAWCGAGLALRLVELIAEQGHIADCNRMVRVCKSLAAIGTVADVVDLVCDNRQIVIEGLQCLKDNVTTTGIQALLRMKDIYVPSVHDIGFVIAPCINACGRLFDDGADFAFRMVLDGDDRAAAKALETNETRKLMVNEAMAKAEQIIADECLFGLPLLFIATPREDGESFAEGIVGIVAGRLAEKYKCPTFVVTEARPGVFKGSGRSYKNALHLKNLLDTVSEHLLAYGGHEGAAGLSFNVDDLDTLNSALLNAAASQTCDTDDAIEYDLEISMNDLKVMVDASVQYEPFGQGNPQIIFKVTDCVATPRAGKTFRTMGADGSTLKIFTRDADVIAFGMAKDYENMGSPHCFDVIGTASYHTFGATTTLQVEAEDIQGRFATPQSELSQRLRELLNKH